ncbi:YafY family protein [Streptomyces sp. NPDC001523]|uniref:helix-turn-helix transcriptional regulator n=1 Tax=Streptomyces sp. NPDC001523 TaxID=3154383 RepID=UPI00331AF62D
MPRPIARVLTLLELLQSGGIRPVSELADRLDVDERTVRRYVQRLLDIDVPVESVRGRYGGYRLAPGYRLPPLMLSDDEALAVLLGLVAGRRSGLTAATDTASETASAKIRRVLPERLRRRLDAVLGSLALTDPPGKGAAPDPGVLLPIAEAVHHHRPISIRYTAGDGRRSERTLQPYGVVAHAGRWYVTAADPSADRSADEGRTFRLDRITDVRILPGSFEPPAAIDPVKRVLTGLATAPYRHEVTLRVQGTVGDVHPRLPSGLAVLSELPSPDSAPSDAAPWCRVELRVDRLDWLPAVLASLDRPFVIDRPVELRALVEAFAERLADSARRRPPRD